MQLMGKTNQSGVNDGNQVNFSCDNFVKTKLVRHWLSSIDEAALRRPRAWQRTHNFLLISEKDTNDAAVNELRRLNEHRCSLSKLLELQIETEEEDIIAHQISTEISPMTFDLTRAICPEPARLSHRSMWAWFPIQFPLFNRLTRIA